MKWFGSAYVHITVDADTEQEARHLVREAVERAGMQIGLHLGPSAEVVVSRHGAPSNAVGGVRADLAGEARRSAKRLAEDLGIAETEVESHATSLGIAPYGRNYAGTAIYTCDDAERIVRHIRALLGCEY